MGISNIEKSRKRLFALLCIGFSLPAVLGFIIIDLIEGDTLEAIINIIVGIVFVAGFIVIKKSVVDLMIYRLLLI